MLIPRGSGGWQILVVTLSIGYCNVSHVVLYTRDESLDIVPVVNIHVLIHVDMPDLYPCIFHGPFMVLYLTYLYVIFLCTAFLAAQLMMRKISTFLLRVIQLLWW